MFHILTSSPSSNARPSHRCSNLSTYNKTTPSARIQTSLTTYPTAAFFFLTVCSYSILNTPLDLIRPLYSSTGKNPLLLVSGGCTNQPTFTSLTPIIDISPRAGKKNARNPVRGRFEPTPVPTGSAGSGVRDRLPVGAGQSSDAGDVFGKRNGRD